MKHYAIFIALGLIFSSCAKKTEKVLVFSKTEGFRHSSIPAGIEAVKRIGQKNSFGVVATEDATIFTQNQLKDFVAVIFMNTTGDILNDQQQIEFQRYIQAGGGFVGVHSAADTEYDWPWYNELVGAYFHSHPSDPNVREAIIHKTANKHISTDHLPDVWSRSDEWYNYKSIFKGIKSILNLDESSYEGGANGAAHPIAWYHEYDGGRSFYTGGGHTDESFSEAEFVEHLARGIEWVSISGRKLNYNKPNVMPEENRFVLDVYESFFNEPMQMALMPDNRIIIVERRGDIKIYEPNEGKTRVLTHIVVNANLEDGLMGIALDPNYATNKYAYICYSDPVESRQNVSRFVFDPDSDAVLTDERIILTVPVQRDECCHSAGYLRMGPDGNLWASFGDNTNPFFSDGHSPADERVGRGAFDAQKSSANMNDLRGKIIRITVNEDATYSIPDGNLFPKDGSQGRPEIYVMGCRNPFRFSIDPKNGYLYWGDVGPDARDDHPERGPRGYDEVNQAKKPGFFGWPYFIADNKAYARYDFATSKIGSPQDPSRPINNSPHNTGGNALPPAQPAMIYYPYGKSEEFPLVKSGGRNAMAGPIYYKDLHQGHANAYPSYYDGKFFAYEWMRGWMMAVSFDENGDMKSMEPFVPSIKWSNLMDVILTPEGDFLMLEYGAGWFTANKDARLSRLRYVSANRQPVAKFETSDNAGGVPFRVDFDATSTVDYDGDDLKYHWDFGDGATAQGSKVSHSFTKGGEYTVVLKVTDPKGESSVSQTKILAGNAPPKVDITIAGNNQFYWPGASLNYRATASDQEDGEISTENISLTIDYLERGYDMVAIAQGHLALSEINRKHPGLELIEANDCVSCHKIDGSSIGPSYTEVAEKYKGRQSQNIAYLSDKIINGGGGVWGETAMAAHPELALKDATSMAEYIMSLSSTKKEIAIPASGIYRLDIPKGNKPGGTWVLMASYTDKGAIDASPMKGFKNVALQRPYLNMADFTSIEVSTKFTLTPQLVPTIESDMDVVIGMHDGEIVFDNIDLTDVGSITITAMTPGVFVGGGTIECHIDKIADRAVASIDLAVSDSPAPRKLTLDLPEITGRKRLVLKTKAKDVTKPVGVFIGMNLDRRGDRSLM